VNETAFVGYGAAAAAHVAFWVYLWRRQDRAAPSDAAQRLLLSAVLASALWAALEAAGHWHNDRAWPIAALLADMARYALWIGFLGTLVGRASGFGSSRPLRLGLASLVVVAIAGQLVRANPTSIDEDPARWQLVLLLALPLVGLFLLEQVFRSQDDDSRWHAKPMVLGLAVVFVFDVYMVSEAMMFGGPGGDTQAARGLVHLFAVPVLFFGARRRADWVSRLKVSRSAALHSATLVLAGLYLLVLSAVGYYIRFFGGTWGGALQIGLLFGALAFFTAVVVSGSLRSWLRVFLGKHFFSYRYDYREQWLTFTAALSAGGTPQEVGLQVIKGLANMVECPAGSLWLRSDSDGPFMQAVTWNMPREQAAEAADSDFARFMREQAWVIDLDEFRSAPRRYEGLALPAWLLASHSAWLVVPLLAGDALLGFVVLAQPRARIEINWEVRDLLKTASRQAAGYLAQMQATEALLEARKFDAFNRMSAFVVHDLKNIVTQLSLMLKNAERLHDNREFQQDMLLTVESSLEKMRRLMLQLREGAAPPGGSRGVELAPIVRRLESMARAQGRSLDVERVERLATRGHDDRLERVLGHLVQNALDATPPDRRVWVQVERHGGQVKIDIGDNGSGMSEEFVQTRLFKPFSTTKASGMGVGSYESAQYIRELGGSIRVTSRVGEGTVVTTLLPLFEGHDSATLMGGEAR
jgi:putative PEP-CTERM system histidine kinase